MTYYDEVHIPEKYIIKHNLCLYFHDVCVSIFHECLENDQLKGYKIEENGRTSLEGIEQAEDVIDWLRSNEYEVEASIVLKRKIFHSLLGDFLSFVLESLKASEKGKTAVSYTLLRKPFKDNLFYLEWICTYGDELLSLIDAGDIDKYEIGGIRKFQNKKMRKILLEAMNKNEFKKLLNQLDDNYMYELRYDYNSPFGLELMWNKANHLVTTAKSIRTIDFNNIFLTEDDFINRWDYYYGKLPTLMLYSTGVVIKLYEELFEPIPYITKLYNNIFLETKWFSSIKEDVGKEYIEEILCDNEIPLYCDECEEVTNIDINRIKEIQYDWGIKCDHCNGYISLSKYQFIEEVID
ncbi:hypothetical protein ACOQFO_00970 [Ureibacillus sp. MALMAid1270]|uniref:hypothetical protein n=1 Tax=Ureibacillus sp. MALMAid1270 TaxID=3411629 RepID=UPI003BA4DB07